MLAPVILTLAAFSALAVLVARGDLSGIDGYFVRHLMAPPSTDVDRRASLLERVVGYPRNMSVHGVFVFPASGAAATVVVLGLAVLLWRRGGPTLAVAYGALYAVGNGIEAVCKELVSRPPLRVMTRTGPFHLGSLDSSFPSGHALRAMMIASGVVLLSRRLLPFAAAWVAAIVVTLAFAGYHTPTDVAGGLLLATSLVLLLVTLQNQPALERLSVGTPGSRRAT